MNCPDCDREMHTNRCACGFEMPPEPPPVKISPVYVPPVSRPTRQKPVEQSYRARWYRENKFPYEPPTLDACPPFQCVGSALPNRFVREPGADTDEDVYGSR